MMTGRREFIKVFLTGLGAAVSSQFLLSSKTHGVMKAADGHISDLKVRAMDFNIRYITEIMNPPKKGKGIEMWMPLPQSDYEQQITNTSVHSPALFKINEEEIFGNKMVHIGPSVLKRGDRIILTYRVFRKTAGTIEQKEDIKKHLVLTEREKWDKNIARFVDDVVGSEKKPLDVGRKIYYALVDYLTYDNEIQGCGQGDSIWTFEQRRGKCDDFHALFRTMLIYRGIPAKWEQGIALSYPSAISRSGEFEGDCTGAHCWVRFYIGDGRWVPVDISEANKRKEMRDYFFGTLSPNRFKLSTGRDVVLNPPQGGGALNTFYFAYGESDGVPLIYGHHYRNIVKYELLNIEV